jgi:pimeloyl-ACP methyl ester carboxylesterase
VSGEQFPVEDSSEGCPLRVTANGVTLWTESFGPGNGTPLLLVMGAMNQGLFWPRAFCEQLAKAGFLVVRYDHRDTGRSSIVDYRRHPYTLTEMTGDALAVLDAYGCTAAAVVGMSMGGYIAQLLAAESPRRVSGLVLLSTTADHRPYMAATMGCDAGQSALPPPLPSFVEYVKSAGRRVQAGADDFLALTLDGWRVTHGGSLPFPEPEMRAMIRAAAVRTSDASAVYHHALAVAASPPRSDILHRIAAPTLVIHGAFDPCLPLPHGQHLAAGIPNARLLVLDMGHMLPPPMAAEVGGAIVSFLHDTHRAAPEDRGSAS